MSLQLCFRVGGLRLHPRVAAALARHVPDRWQDDAACAGAERLKAWFPDARTPRNSATLVKPLRTCAACPVRRPCLAFALLGEESGLWGGVIENDRTAALNDLAAGVEVDTVLDSLLAGPRAASPGERVSAA